MQFICALKIFLNFEFWSIIYYDFQRNVRPNINTRCKVNNFTLVAPRDSARLNLHMYVFLKRLCAHVYRVMCVCITHISSSNRTVTINQRNVVISYWERFGKFGFLIDEWYILMHYITRDITCQIAQCHRCKITTRFHREICIKHSCKYKCIRATRKMNRY